VKLIVSRWAAADIERLRVFLENKNRAAAERAVVILSRAIQSLGNLPDRGRPAGKPGIRELIVPFGQSAYVVRYAHRADAGEVVVLRIWHGREERD
jgi:plasmid stabilization system protein ParE